jgi:NADH-quinone oxidoreductase subunit N
LAGIPPVAGFFAKYYLFYGTLMSGYTWLVLVAVLSSLIGVYYYFRVIYTIFQPHSQDRTPVTATESHRVLVLLAALASLVLGIFPEVLKRLF